MTTKRTPLRRALKPRITPDVLELWRQLKEIEAKPGGRERRAYQVARRDLDDALGIPPWQLSPIEAEASAPDYMISGNLVVGLDGWRTARAWRRALEAATRAH